MTKNQRSKQKKALKKRRKDKVRKRRENLAPRSRVQERASATSYYLVPFAELFPEQQAEELPILTIQGDEDDSLVGDYALVDLYCSNPECDCQDALLSVVEQPSGEHVAAIDVDLSGESKPRLSPTKGQGPDAPQLFELVNEEFLSDPNYLAMLKTHYRKVKRAISKPTPGQKRVLLEYQD